MKKRRMLAPFMMLLAGTAASITMYLFGYDIRELLGILIPILISFYFIGFLFYKMLDWFERENKKIAAAEAAKQEAIKLEAMEQEAGEQEAPEQALAGNGIPLGAGR